MFFSMIIKAEDHGPDQRVWVELRGPEPLTPVAGLATGRLSAHSFIRRAELNFRAR